MLYTIEIRGKKKVKVFAFKSPSKVFGSIITEHGAFTTPVLFLKERPANGERDEASEDIFRNLDWSKMIDYPLLTRDKTLLVYCQGHSFELKEIE